MTLSCTVAHRATVTLSQDLAMTLSCTGFRNRATHPGLVCSRTRTCAICACSHVQLAEQKLQKLLTQWAHVTVLNRFTGTDACVWVVKPQSKRHDLAKGREHISTRSKEDYSANR